MFDLPKQIDIKKIPLLGITLLLSMILSAAIAVLGIVLFLYIVFSGDITETAISTVKPVVETVEAIIPLDKVESLPLDILPDLVVRPKAEIPPVSRYRPGDNCQGCD